MKRLRRTVHLVLGYMGYGLHPRERRAAEKLLAERRHVRRAFLQQVRQPPQAPNTGGRESAAGREFTRSEAVGTN